MTRLTTCIRLALFLAIAGLGGAATHCLGQETFPLPQVAAVTRAIRSIAFSDLPVEGQRTLQLIKRGGPFPYPGKDGSVFGNFEQRLPLKSRGYYREFTVPTPGRHDRGARRIIAGLGTSNNVADSGEYYYTADHYRHFRRIREQ